MEFRFEARASKHNGKFVVQVDFKKIKAVLKLKNLWQCESFVLGAPTETGLKPEGQSKHLVYQYLTSQVNKIYAVYDAISNFPVGLLLILLYMHSLNLFENKCKCYRVFDLSCGLSFGLLPPVFRDMWMRDDCVVTQMHNMC